MSTACVTPDWPPYAGRVPLTQSGMLLGIIAGAAVGVVLFATTNDALWLTLPGVGVALGLGVGASLEKRRSRDEDPG